MEQGTNKRQLQKQHTLEILRDTVDELVRDVGFEAMTIREICRRSGVSTGAFYHYFASKDDLLFDRYCRGQHVFSSLYQEKLSQLPPLEALREFLGYLETFCVTRVMDLTVQYHKTIIIEYEKWIQNQEDVVLAIMTDLLEKALADGALVSPHSAQELGGVLWTMYMGANFAHSMTRGRICNGTPLYGYIIEWLDSMVPANH